MGVLGLRLLRSGNCRFDCHMAQVHHWDRKTIDFGVGETTEKLHRKCSEKTISAWPFPECFFGCNLFCVSLPTKKLCLTAFFRFVSAEIAS